MIEDVYKVVRQVAQLKGMSVEEIMSDNATHEISYARKLSFYILFIMFDMNHREIAEYWQLSESTVCRHVNDILYGKKSDAIMATDTISLIKQFRNYDDKQPTY